MTPLTQHPDSKLFPPMSNEEYEELKGDIKKRFQINPIVMYEGKILDGWHRYRACIELGIEPHFTAFANTVITSLDYVISQNLTRRHLTGSQRAAVAVEYKKLISTQVHKRHINNMSIRMKAMIRNEPVPEHVKGLKPRSSELAGKIFGINHRAVEKACAIDKRDKNLLEEVRAGREPLETAYRKVMGKPQSIARTEAIDRRARNVLNDLDFSDYKPPESVHASDFEIWEFDRYMKHKGYNLCLTRIGDSWDAVYTKSDSKPTSGCVSWKAAVFSAGKETINKEKVANEK